jgi:hypothetical protein
MMNYSRTIKCLSCFTVLQIYTNLSDRLIVCFIFGQYNLQTADCRPDWVQNADWGYKMQTEDKMQTGGELGLFYKFPPSHSHVIVLVDNINFEASHFHQN